MAACRCPLVMFSHTPLCLTVWKHPWNQVLYSACQSISGCLLHKFTGTLMASIGHVISSATL